MASNRSLLPKVIIATVFLVIGSVLFIAYSDLTMEQQIAALYVIKLILAVSAAVFLLLSQVKWAVTKHNMPILKFYAKSKLFKSYMVEGAGIVFLAAAFFLDFAQFAHWIQGECVVLAINLLEALALVFFSYSYYKLARQELA